MNGNPRIIETLNGVRTAELTAVNLSPVRVGETVPEQFQAALELEYAAIKRLNDGIAVCVEVGDNTTRTLLEGILVSEEAHADWLETQLEAMRQLGESNHLGQQLDG